MSLRDISKKIAPKLITLALVATAAVTAYTLYVRYTDRPWTRDAQVSANVVQITPRVSGYLVQVAVKDNHFVKKGELLFQIDPSSYQLTLDQALVALDQAREGVVALEANVRAAHATVEQQRAAVTSATSQIDEALAGVNSAGAAIKEAESGVLSAKALIAQTKAQLDEAGRESARADRLAKSKAGSVETAESKAAAVKVSQAQVDSANAGLQQAQASLSKAKSAQDESQSKVAAARSGLVEAQAAVTTAIANVDQAKAQLGQAGDANVNVRSAQVQVEGAKLQLKWTSIYAPADGYITNMSLLKDTFVSAGTPFALFVDSSTFHVDAYFEETKLRHIQPGDQATITLMGYHNQPIEGEVESLGYAINPPNLAETEGPGNLVPTIQPSFDWIRLAQRVPVRIRFKKIPDDLHLVSGTTASVSIRK